MSIQTELTRIINAKAAIKTAIEGKGVTVPDGTLLDGMASLIGGADREHRGGGRWWISSCIRNIYTSRNTIIKFDSASFN